MKANRCLFYEGMFLQHHHFQQMYKAMDYEHSFIIQSVNSNFFGFAGISIDTESVKNGEIRLEQASGIMPDGYLFEMPGKDMLPEARHFKDHFPSTSSSLKIYLCLPESVPNAQNIGFSENGNSQGKRYKKEDMELFDDNTGQDKLTISVYSSNFVIKFENESRDGFSYLPVCEISRDQSSEYILSGTYIPNCIQLSASDNLQKLLSALLEKLVSCNAALSRRRRQDKYGNTQFSSSEMDLYHILQNINEIINMLNYNLSSKDLHPQNIFLALSNFLAKLYAFDTQRPFIIDDIPAYNHNNLTTSFLTLIDEIGVVLDEVMPIKKYEFIKLSKQEQASFILYIGKLDGVTNLAENRIYLRLEGDIDVNDIKNISRITTPEKINHIIKYNTAGIKLEYLNNIPKDLPYQKGMHYFYLSQSGEHWNHVLNEKRIVICLPKKYSNNTLSLLTLRQD